MKTVPFASDFGHLPIRAILVLAALCGSFSPASAEAQTRESTLPNSQHFLALQPYYEGEYRNALRSFQDVAQGGYRGIDGRWIDSICYHAMLGECYYRMGDLGQALDQYEAALRMFVTYKDWMLRVEFPAAIEPSSSTVRATINWGGSKRASKLGEFPDKVVALIGRLDNDRVVRQGGVVDPPELRPIRAHEIVRCTALSIRRRSEIMGPTCKHDPFTAQLVAALSRRPAPPNHWSQAWIDVQLGLAYAAADRPKEAASALAKGVFAGGMYDHVLTGTALLELGKLSFDQGKFDLAADFFFEATLAAAQFQQLSDLEEAFRYATTTYLVAGKKGVYPPLVNAATWARTNAGSVLQTSLAALAAECSAASGQTQAAATFLEQAQREMARTDIHLSDLGARLQYQSAHVNFQRGNTAVGNANLASSMAYQRTSSKRLFQIALADKLYLDGKVSPRVADLLFEEVLREPIAKDWKLDPMETMGVVVTPHLDPLEHWFELVLLQRKEPERALEIADRIRRHRFFSTLPAGGRLLSLRWILEAPDEALNERAVREKQDFLLRYPKYAEVSRQAKAVQAELRKLPLAPKIKETADAQVALLGQLAKLTAMQEAALSDIALRREPSEFTFPPLLDIKRLRQSMPENQLVLAYFRTKRSLYVFQIGKGSYSYREITEPHKLQIHLTGMLRAMGHFDRNQILLGKNLTNDVWTEPARKLRRLLIPERRNEQWQGVKELVIVPDGPLWYVPFDTLPIYKDEQWKPMAAKFRIRYAPTVSTTQPDDRAHKRTSSVAIVTGKLFPKDDEEFTAAAFDEFRAVLPEAARLESDLAAPSGLLSSLCDRLVVLDEIDNKNGGPYQWAPMQLDRGKPGSTLNHWFSLPWTGPEQVVLPGFQSAAADAVRHGGSGDEMFLNVCGLMATGARSILISRWRTGGQSSIDLTREFMQEWPNSSATRAWRRSCQLFFAGEVNPELEPRVNSAGLSEGLPADHPFFWAGYMLVDTGSSPKPEADEKPAAGD